MVQRGDQLLAASQRLQSNAERPHGDTAESEKSDFNEIFVRAQKGASRQRMAPTFQLQDLFSRIGMMIGKLAPTHELIAGCCE